MPAQDVENSALPLPVLLLLVTVAGSLFWIQTPLTSSRPDGLSGSHGGSIGDQNVESRLWEDPLNSIERSENDGPKESAPALTIDSSFSNLALQIWEHAADPNLNADDVLILPSFISGGAYAEDVEGRIRCRQALISALGVAGYAPDDESHLGHFKIPWLRSREIPQDLKTCLEDDNIPLIGTVPPQGAPLILDVPFEWHRRREHHQHFDRNGQFKAVLVLWLKEDYFEDDPLFRLAQFIKSLRHGIHELRPTSVSEAWCSTNESAPPSPTNKVAILGPYTSTVLRAMLPWQFSDDAWGNYQDRVQNGLFKNVEMYSYSASAMDGLLVKRTQSSTPRKEITQLLEWKGIRFYKVNCTQDELANQIWEELHQRGIHIDSADAHVALISEFDTFYGRMLPLTFALEAQRLIDPGFGGLGGSYTACIERFRTNSGLWPTNLHRFAYLRGIDGRSPGNKSEQSPQVETKKKFGDEDKPKPELERPEGPSQLDYIPRLAERLENLNRELKRTGKGELRAIGVVGSDVYDTLLILQALNGRFPKITFFTTDLDARVWHPSQLKWTRNLIVASSFGLQLGSNLQREAPPFRDSSQTAEFAAALIALGDIGTNVLDEISPRVFEIGRHGPVDLSIERSNARSTNVAHSALHPPAVLVPSTSYVESIALKGIVALTLGLFLIIHFVPPLRRYNALTGIGWQNWYEPLLLQGKRIRKFQTLIEWLEARANAVAQCAHDCLTERTRQLLSAHQANPSVELETSLLDDLNRMIVSGESFEVGDSILSDCAIRLIAARNCKWYAGIACIRRSYDRCINMELVRSHIPELIRNGWYDPLVLIQAQGVRAVRLANVVLDQLPPDCKEIIATTKTAGLTPEQESTLSAAIGNILSNSSFYDLMARDPSMPSPAVIQLLAKKSNRCYKLRCFRRLTSSRLNRQLLEDAIPGALVPSSPQFDIMRKDLGGFYLSVGLSLLGIVGLGTAIIWDHYYNPLGERFSVTNGTSAWPTEIIRLLALYLSCFWISRGYFSLARNHREIEEEFCLATNEHVSRAERRTFHSARYPRNETLSSAFRNLPRRLLALLKLVLNRRVPSWHPVTSRSSAQQLWTEYITLAQPLWRITRVFCIWLVAFFFALSVLKIFGLPNQPIRGSWCQAVDYILLYSTVVASMWLVFFVVDATRLCRRLIVNLSANPTQWPDDALIKYSALRADMKREDLDEWMDIKLIAKHTDTVGRLIYYPFIVIVVMIVARSEYLDNWRWSVPLAFVVALNLAYALYSAMLLKSTAMQTRQSALESLNEKLWDARRTRDLKRRKQIELTIKEVEESREGAFASFHHHPIFRAVLIPFGGAGLISLIEYLTSIF